MSTELQKNEEGRLENVHASERFRVPAVDIYESEEELLLHVELPGVGADGLRLDIQDSELTIEGTPMVEHAPAGWAGPYRRAFLLPPGIDMEKVGAQMNQGVLTVQLPKHASLRPRRIEVRAG